uniref:RING-type domain-containing protein n=1 Tax=viral metagenome TaxID=1070528 RepID=A0A6C0F4N8_9ZZZZ
MSNRGTFSNDQRIMLNFYLAAYNDIRRDIDHLYESLDYIVGHINTLSRNVESHRADNVNRHDSRSNTNRHRSSRTADSIINDYLYNDFSIPRFSRNNIRQTTPHINVLPRQNTSATENPIWARSRAQVFDLLGQFYNNVPVVPTREEIDRATRRIVYREIESPLNSTCMICLDRFQPDDSVIQIIHCGHIFNEDSINVWFRANVRCPICRHDIREASSPTQPLTSNTETIPSTENVDHENEDEGEDEGEDEDEGEENNNPHLESNTNNDPSHNSSPSETARNLFAGAQNFRVERNPTTNSIDRISYDLTDDNLISSITNLAGDLLFGHVNTNTNTNTSTSAPIQYNNGNQRFVYDPSNNMVLFETYFQSGL